MEDDERGNEESQYHNRYNCSVDGQDFDHAFEMETGWLLKCDAIARVYNLIVTLRLILASEEWSVLVILVCHDGILSSKGRECPGLEQQFLIEKRSICCKAVKLKADDNKYKRGCQPC
jgi:hypothetical protein